LTPDSERTGNFTLYHLKRVLYKSAEWKIPQLIDNKRSTILAKDKKIELHTKDLSCR